MRLTPCLCIAAAASSVSATFAGFANLQRLIVFGDSYSATRFSPNGTQPSPGNPMGNFRQVRTNGPKWPQYLTSRYNQSTFLTYNLASTGSPVNTDIISTPVYYDFGNQIDLFKQTYGINTTTGATMFQNPNTTLVATWFGTNEVMQTFWAGNLTDNSSWDKTYDAVFTSYFERIEALYSCGARNFLFINVPPVHRNPLIRFKEGGQLVDRAASLIANMNRRVASLAARVREAHPDTSVYTYDAYTMLSRALDRPRRYQPLLGIRSLFTYCRAYYVGTAAIDTKLPECKYAVNEYFWFDSIHPGSAVHDFIASNIAQVLQSPRRT